MVNNAVYPVNSKFDGLEISDEKWENAFRINILGSYRFLDAATPHLKSDGGGALAVELGEMGIAVNAISPGHA